MKTALCLHGYFANAGGVEASVKGDKYITSKIPEDTEVFMHSWDVENASLMMDLYNPVSVDIEHQKDFSEELQGFDESQFESPNKSDIYKPNTIAKTLSFLLSRKKSIGLKTEYETETGCTYDCVILARFDLGQRGKEHPQTYYATNFNFSKSLNMDLLYSIYWDQLNHGFGDHWFYSSSKNMNIVGDLYDKVFEYYQADSGYVKAVQNGWPDSNQDDLFSNEMLKEEKATNLWVNPKHTCIDNHKLYKWYFMQTGLYEKCSFVDITRNW